MIYRADPSAFLNYAVTLRNFDSYAVFAEGGLSVMGALLFSGASRNDDGTVVRGLSNLTYDDRSRLVRVVLGDRLATSDALGGSLVMGGLSVSREFSIDPYFASFPGLDLSGVATTPSTADLYVNGRLQRQEVLAPGTFRLRDVPVPAGGGVARLVVRDAFGRERDIVSPFYLTTTLLAEGLNDYSYNLGLPPGRPRHPELELRSSRAARPPSIRADRRDHGGRADRGGLRSREWRADDHGGLPARRGRARRRGQRGGRGSRRRGDRGVSLHRTAHQPRRGGPGGERPLRHPRPVRQDRSPDRARSSASWVPSSARAPT